MATLEEYLQQQGVAQTKDEFFRDAVRQSANREFELKTALREAYTAIVERHWVEHETPWVRKTCCFCEGYIEEGPQNPEMDITKIEHEPSCMVLTAKQWLADNPS